MEARSQYVNALCREMELQRDFFHGEPIHTVYFGGGTPSQLEANDFWRLFMALQLFCKGRETSTGTPFEITLEANPDDLTPEYLSEIRSLPFNRISLGVQSFNDKELSFLNRRHDARSATDAVKNCQSAGFRNISIDLMYGLPGQSLKSWKDDLKKAIDLNIQHISAYHLIYEESTPLYRSLKSEKITPVDENTSVTMFELLMEQLNDAGFEHYEISSFARSGFRSQHNSSYWNGTPYLGLGASAHSYDGKNRQWNVSSISKYTNAINQGIIPAELEISDDKTIYNDYVITRVRTKEGIDLDELSGLFGDEARIYCLKQADKHIQKENLILTSNYLHLSRKGIFISDSIMSDLLK